jgi:hypothetical protein
MRVQQLTMSSIASADSHLLILGIRLNSLLERMAERINGLSLAENAIRRSRQSLGERFAINGRHLNCLIRAETPNEQLLRSTAIQSGK